VVFPFYFWAENAEKNYDHITHRILAFWLAPRLQAKATAYNDKSKGKWRGFFLRLRITSGRVHIAEKVVDG